MGCCIRSLVTTEMKEGMVAPFAPWLRAVGAFQYTFPVAEYCGDFVNSPQNFQVDLMVVVALVAGTLQITARSRLVCSPFVVFAQLL